MKYIAQPVEVDAFVILRVEIGMPDRYGLALDDGQEIEVWMGPGTYVPQPGDYWVVSPYRQIGLMPKEAFEHDYKSRDAIYQENREELLDGKIAMPDGARFATEPYRDMEMLKRRGLVDENGDPL